MKMKAFFKHWRKGDIILWYGAVADIRKGWALCNGANGTPDLDGVTVICAGVTYAVGYTGGNVEHTHAVTGDGHDHNILAGPPNAIQSGSGYDNVMDSTAITGGTDTKNHLPPFHALCFIMKL